MAVSAPPTGSEREMLIGFIAQQRRALRLSLHGLTDEQARARPSASELTLGGLVKHAALTEREWIERATGRETGSEEEYVAGFVMRPDETVEDMVRLQDEVAAETSQLLSTIDLDQLIPVPKAPWFPQGLDAWSVRWIANHVVEELARHAGHADIIRECLDGQTAYSLMAAAARDVSGES
jgi:uncharacterized damage-inducible protein DinB